jgi:hypothetical protein
MKLYTFRLFHDSAPVNLDCDVFFRSIPLDLRPNRRFVSCRDRGLKSAIDDTWRQTSTGTGKNSAWEIVMWLIDKRLSLDACVTSGLMYSREKRRDPSVCACARALVRRKRDNGLTTERVSMCCNTRRTAELLVLIAIGSATDGKHNQANDKRMESETIWQSGVPTMKWNNHHLTSSELSSSFHRFAALHSKLHGNLLVCAPVDAIHRRCLTFADNSHFLFRRYYHDFQRTSCTVITFLRWLIDGLVALWRISTTFLCWILWPFSLLLRQVLYILLRYPQTVDRTRVDRQLWIQQYVNTLPIYVHSCSRVSHKRAREELIWNLHFF